MTERQRLTLSPLGLRLGDGIAFDGHSTRVCAPAPYRCPQGVVVTVEWFEEGERIEDYGVFKPTDQLAAVRVS